MFNCLCKVGLCHNICSAYLINELKGEEALSITLKQDASHAILQSLFLEKNEYIYIYICMLYNIYIIMRITCEHGIKFSIYHRGKICGYHHMALEFTMASTHSVQYHQFDTGTNGFSSYMGSTLPNFARF